MGARELRVNVDVGCRLHSVAVGLSSGELLEEFDIAHRPAGFAEFFRRIETHRRRHGLPVAVAMEGYNGYARPLDHLVQSHDYQLYNVNNLKLARFKEIFPAAAKSDRIDARKGLELFQLQEVLPLAKRVLQPVPRPPVENARLKRLTRRRRVLVEEKGRVLSRLQADLHAVSPGLLAITNDADNLWFLHLLTHSDDLRKLARLQPKTLLKIPAIGRSYAARIRQWQAEALFSHEVEYVGPMIIDDARRLLALRAQIKALECQCQALLAESAIAGRIATIPGFGLICASELAGEIGSVHRFAGESSLALYLGMTSLDNRSGTYQGSKPSKHVNTRARGAMMTAVDRHRKCVPESQRYYEKKRAEGKTHNQAIRALGRHLCRVLYKMLTQHRPYERRPA